MNQLAVFLNFYTNGMILYSCNILLLMELCFIQIPGLHSHISYNPNVLSRGWDGAVYGIDFALVLLCIVVYKGRGVFILNLIAKACDDKETDDLNGVNRTALLFRKDSYAAFGLIRNTRRCGK